MSQSFDHLLDEIKRLHEKHAVLKDFCSFPGDIQGQAVMARHVPPCDVFLQSPAYSCGPWSRLAEAFRQAAPEAYWRLTYEGTDIGQDFMDRFGCYCLVGEGGAFKSAHMASYLVFMPPNLYYPWHEHPAEELYVVVGGEADFMRFGEPTETLKAGGTSQHASNQPHAMQTKDEPVLAYVVWRNHFGHKPVLSHLENNPNG